MEALFSTSGRCLVNLSCLVDYLIGVSCHPPLDDIISPCPLDPVTMPAFPIHSLYLWNCGLVSVAATTNRHGLLWQHVHASHYLVFHSFKKHSQFTRVTSLLMKYTQADAWWHNILPPTWQVTCCCCPDWTATSSRHWRLTDLLIYLIKQYIIPSVPLQSTQRHEQLNMAVVADVD
jgi:hypothetical protein